MTISAKTCLIIGTGISGLMAGQELQKNGWTVTLVDKARGVGGRMATRRVEGGTFDHGAQFFTVRDPQFQRIVDSWLQKEVVSVWSHGFIEDADTTPHSGHPRYRGVPGMTGIAKHLAAGLDIRLQTRVTSIRLNGSGWEAISEDGSVFHSDAVILTSPVPQSLVLLESGGFQLRNETIAALETIQYDPCIALMALTSEQGQVPEPGAIRLTTGDVRWVADNFRKGVSKAYGLTVHTSPDFSQANWEKDKSDLAEEMIKLAKPWLGGKVLGWSIQKWRYSQPQSAYPERCLVVPGAYPLIFAGDAFGGARVEGAALSGLEAADTLLTGEAN